MIGKAALSLALMSISMVQASNAGTTTYSCSAVDKEAKLGIDASSSVSISESSSDKKCSFSVGGASIDKMEVPEFFDAVNEILSGKFDDLSISSPNKDKLMYALVSPFRHVDSSASPGFNNVISFRLSDFGSCISQYRNGGPSFGGFNEDNAFCKVFDKDNKVSIGGVEVDSNEPVLGIGVRLDGIFYMLFLNSHLFDRARLGQPFR
ncbi:hypothetical protein [Mesorhizobium carmichaelinearum]|uniref:hypothetical protein n=1 Tax=Mesorhizobium carmichaelinearum TaxID=1208188 RepID=UPI001181205F|nr:hypothetical protein [Mesorhizobium carmichaelinearum]